MKAAKASPSVLVLAAAAVFSLCSLFMATLAEAQTAHSPEAFLDCKQIDFGPNRFDNYGKCCLPSEQNNCRSCFNAVTDVGCGCGNPAPNECNSCTGSKACYGCDGVANSGKVTDGQGGCCKESERACGRCSGCRGCSLNSHCQNPNGPPACNPGYSDPSNPSCPWNFTIAHGSTLTRITHLSHQQGTGYLWSSNVAGEQLSCFSHSESTWRCNDGTMVPN